MNRQLVMIELNEINFDVVRNYIKGGTSRFPSLQKMMAGHEVHTSSESSYELLEPWIQWVSVHTGMSFDEHGIFRLGDMAETTYPQFFELLEEAGLLVGAISPMNAANRLKQPAYFIPDPWTKTSTDGSWWSNALTAAISQAVNDNAQARLTPSSAVKLMLGLLRFARPGNYLTYLKLAITARRKPWRKALFLDLFLHDVHLRLMNARKPGFSVLFLNAGAHIQHHYFLNARPVLDNSALRNPEWYVSSNDDPVGEMLDVYDRIIGDYLQLDGRELLVATGLSQRPYDRVKFYYRLRDHAAFLKLVGVTFLDVAPRMTRDFLIMFSSEESARLAESRLGSLVDAASGQKLFGEIDNRGDSLFVTLTFPDEISETKEFLLDGIRHKLAPHVAFVAIKNGMHDPQGFAFFSKGVASFAPEQGEHVRGLHGAVLGFFGTRSGLPHVGRMKESAK